mmetsp:Transcript_5601/g.18695  ORF Transcript_5601/g.18695 Transcript_5601/m.18695 type:complete len:203 (-) Transcript_5601:285-893(-)
MCPRKAPMYYPFPKASLCAMDNLEPVLQRLRVVVEGRHQLLLRHHPILSLDVEIPLDRRHFAQHLQLEDLVRLIARLERRVKVVLHQHDGGLPRRPLSTHFLLDPKYLIAHPLQRLRLALQTSDLFDFELLGVLIERVQYLLVGLLDVDLPVARFLHQRALNLLDPSDQPVYLRLQRLVRLTQRFLELDLQLLKLHLKHHLQ